MKKILIIFILLSVSVFNLYSQNKTIKGRVIDEYLEVYPGVSIFINDSVRIGQTDLQGFFQINVPATVRKILFKAIGIEPTVIELNDKCNEVKIIAMYSVIYDFITPKKINKLRIKRFNNLPKLHITAFDRGIFKTNETCYIQEFIPD